MYPWNQFVAIGDSFTQGVGDPVDGFEKLGAMDMLATAFRQVNPGLRFTNLAIYGLTVAEIREQQLEMALRLKPDFVSVVAGANDILKGRFDEARWEQEFRMIFEALTQNGAVVGASNLPNFAIINTFKEALQVRIRRNITRGNAIIQHLAEQYRVILVDAWAKSSGLNPDDWSADGVHLNSRGYYKFAKEILEKLEQQVGVKLGNIEAL